MDLALLLERCKAGDALAWETLVREHQARIFGIALHYSGNREDARDLAQEIFVRIYQNLDACTSAEMFMPWIVRIARNACIDHLRRRKARRRDKEVPPDTIGRLPARGKNPEEQWEADERKGLIYRALKQVTALNKEMILLREIQGLPLEEISSMLRIPLGTIKSRCNRARIELARKVLALSGE